MEQFLETLHKQHEMVKDIFEKIKTTETDSEKMDLFTDLKTNLEPHMSGEEKYFYPVLKDKIEYKEDALEAIEEHHAARFVLNELDEMATTDENWDAKIMVLSEIIDHHIKEEEKKLFKDAHHALNNEQFDNISKNFDNEKTQYKEEISAAQMEQRECI